MSMSQRRVDEEGGTYFRRRWRRRWRCAGREASSRGQTRRRRCATNAAPVDDARLDSARRQRRSRRHPSDSASEPRRIRGAPPPSGSSSTSIAASATTPRTGPAASPSTRCRRTRSCDDAKVWEEAVSKLRGRLMPPPGKPQPAQTEIDTQVAWLEGELDTVANDAPESGQRRGSPPEPHRVPARDQESPRISTSMPRRCCRRTRRPTASTTSRTCCKVSPSFLDAVHRRRAAT